LCAALALGACSSVDEQASERSTTTSTTPARRPKVKPATLEGPITVGEQSGPADPKPLELDKIGYVQEEWFASGTATKFTGEEDRDPDGRWSATPAGTAPYKVRFIVRRPKDAADFNGTVVVEWLNVTVVEAAPEWAYASPAIVDDGAAWVGVSAQALSIMGGQSLLQSGDARQAEASGGIKNTNPERYASLDHPGDPYAFDIFSQVGAALRSPGDKAPLGEGRAANVIGAGESQSAGFLTGYVNAIQPIADAYDGFFVHSRGAGAARLDATRAIGASDAYRVRTDLDVPVLLFETETDVGPLLKYGLARQPNTKKIVTWEVAGTAHADGFLVGGQFSACPYPINDGPQHWVATAAMSALLRWVEKGTHPPVGDRIETTGDGTTVTRDEDGLALGGIRTPSVDAPVSELTGASAPGAPVLCALFGKSTPFDTATLQQRYGTKEGYLQAFDTALDAAVAKGFVRKADRAAYAAEGRAFAFPPTA
jgi:hypothetical protein